MTKLFGAQRLVLQTIWDSPKDATGFVTDSQIAQSTRMTIGDVRDSIEILDGDGFVEIVRREEDLSVAINAKGRQTLRQLRPFETAPNESVDSASPKAPTDKSDGSRHPSGHSLKVNLTARVAASTLQQFFGTGEPLRFEVHASVVNLGDTAVFIVAARLNSKSGTHGLDLEKLCDEERPVLAGARRSGTLEISTCRNSSYLYRILRNICQPDSMFEIVTAREERFIYQATEVCDEQFLGWPSYIIDENTLDPSQKWFPTTSLSSDAPAEPHPTPDSVQRDLTHEDIENIRSQVWANVDSFGNSSAICPVDQFPMKITFHTFEHSDAEIAAHCVRHGHVKIEKTSDPLRPTFAGKSWTEAQIPEFAESVLRGHSVKCPVCGTVIRSKKDAGFVILNCLRCGGHRIVPIR
jgi:DNA-binding MarR family transcriptional regulator